MCFFYVVISFLAGIVVGYKCKKTSINRNIIEPQSNVPIADVRSVGINEQSNNRNITVAQIVV
jgi:hypothetical protein